MVNNIFPRCASIGGGITLAINISNINVETSSKIKNITVGFQAKDNKRLSRVLSKQNISKVATSNLSFYFYLVNQESKEKDIPESEKLKSRKTNPLILNEDVQLLII